MFLSLVDIFRAVVKSRLAARQVSSNHSFVFFAFLILNLDGFVFCQTCQMLCRATTAKNDSIIERLASFVSNTFITI